MNLLEQLKRDEGYRQNVYKCTAGRDTIGYGYNLSANPLKLTPAEIKIYYNEGIKEPVAEYILRRCIEQMRNELSEGLGFFDTLDSVRQDALINMAFNLGVSGLLKFRKTLEALKAKRFEEAGVEMLDSTWAIQVGKRAKRLAKQVATGVYQ